MKKEQAAESWEMMAALGGRGPGSGSTPQPPPHTQGSQGPEGAEPRVEPPPRVGRSPCGRGPQGPKPHPRSSPAHHTEGFRKSCLQGTLVCLDTGRPCARTPKARMRSEGQGIST